MDCPVYDPDEEHDSLVPNAKGTYGPRLENANRMCGDVRTLPAVSAERKEMLMCEEAQNCVVES